MAIKQKLTEVAKDLNISAQEVIDIINGLTGESKRTTSVLQENEINLVLEAYSQRNQVSDFNEYFNSKKTDEQIDNEKEEYMTITTATVARITMQAVITESPTAETVRNRFHRSQDRNNSISLLRQPRNNSTVNAQSLTQTLQHHNRQYLQKRL